MMCIRGRTGSAESRRAPPPSFKRRRNMKVGFIGLGRMGQGMACNLLKAGIPLLVYDANPAAAAAIGAAGAEVADSLSTLAKGAGLIFTSLPGPTEVEAVVLGTGGVLENIRP